ncbi:Major facilitator superfamily [Photobacterium marinum]|uniref:Major facilitator superfamily n=1 Tax=Photobacterium marinum TaxID=1056511 RepID=L8JAC9_9GAMM|nr:MFS transporter [Photobacterium marinum]ELR64412.1 Major facilitator superfamily [Photobacterium marinum]
MTATHKPLSSFGLLLLVAGQLLPQIDFSIVNVALDVMGDTLNTNETGLVLIVALYGLSFATLIATGGRLGDRYGRKRLFMLGVVGFCIASVVCGLATDIIPMLIGRLLQGICGALLMPQILATIHATLKGERHSRAVGIYTSVAGLSVVIGQLLGGWLVSADLFGLSWRIAFFVNIPVCLLILGLGFFIIPETRSENQPHMDTSGITLFALFLLCLLLPIAMGEHWPQLWWLLLGLLPTGVGLWTVEKRKENAGEQPLFPLSLFKTPSVITGFIGEAAVTFTYPGYLFVTALCLQSKLHFNPLQSGNTFMALGIMFFVGSLLSKPMSQRLGNHRSYVVGTGLSFLGFVVTITLFWSFKSTLHVWSLIVATGLVGLGNAMMLTSAFRIALSQVGKHHASEASSALITVQQGCFAIGTAFSGAIYAAMLSHGYLVAIATSIGVLSALLLVIGVVLFCKRPQKNVALTKRGQFG